MNPKAQIIKTNHIAEYEIENKNKLKLIKDKNQVNIFMISDNQIQIFDKNMVRLSSFRYTNYVDDPKLGRIHTLEEKSIGISKEHIMCCTPGVGVKKYLRVT